MKLAKIEYQKFDSVITLNGSKCSLTLDAETDSVMVQENRGGDPYGIPMSRVVRWWPAKAETRGTPQPVTPDMKPAEPMKPPVPPKK
jgi:hypothetical protein